jgi:hypothetical protein
VEVSSVVLDRAEELLHGVTPIRTLDAIHVGSVMLLQSASQMPISFVTAAVRQREAATQFGLDIIWIGN